MHKTERIGDWLDMYQFGLGALAFCIIQMKARLAELGNDEAVELAEEAKAKHERASQLQYDWDQQKRQDPLQRPGTKELDNRIDSTLSDLLQAAEIYTNLEADTREKRLADELVDQLFPSGVYPVTSKEFNAQQVAVDELLNRLRGEFSEHVQALNLGALVDQLDQLNAEFDEALTDTGKSVSYDEVEAARVEVEDAFQKLFIKVLHDYRDDLETLNRLLEPVHEQTRRTRRALKRTGSRPEVDPETGEAVDGEGDGPVADGGENVEDDGTGDGEGDSDGNATSEGDQDTDGDTDDSTSNGDQT